ncbi:MAG: DUF342 domain-containing protein [Clostridia bacterium]|nr:DUF342 domain-containing protein [Clostridia bacterium]
MTATSQKEKEKKRFVIRVSRDHLSAFLTIFPYDEEKENPVTLAQIKNELLKAGIVYGIDEVKILLALNEKKGVTDQLIAEGKKPVPGQNAQLKYYFNPHGVEIKPKELENGRVDFYNISLIQNVKKGQLLVEKIPATRGIPGVNVFGKEIPGLPGKDIPLPIGKNVNVSEDMLKGYAACEGHVVFTGGKVSVLDVLEIKGDVNFSTGNIEYSGNVIIKGHVREGFKVTSKGDVEIFGTVEGGHVFADGNIIVKKGIRGNKKSKIEAKKNVYSNFIENAYVKAGEDIIVNSGIMHSEVNAGLNVQVGGKRGVVVGGVCRAGKSLVCKNLGSNLATITIVEVGVNPDLWLAYNQVSRDIENIKQNLDKADKALKILKQLEEKLNKLPPDKEKLRQKLLDTRKQLQRDNTRLELEKFDLEQKIKKIGDGIIKVSETINCGVQISMGKAKKHFTSEMKRVVLKLDGMDISIEPLVS